MLYSKQLTIDVNAHSYSDAVEALSIEEMRIEFTTLRGLFASVGGKAEQFSSMTKEYVARYPASEQTPAMFVLAAHSLYIDRKLRKETADAVKQGICPEHGGKLRNCRSCRLEAAADRRAEIALYGRD